MKRLRFRYSRLALAMMCSAILSARSQPIDEREAYDSTPWLGGSNEGNDDGAEFQYGLWDYPGPPYGTDYDYNFQNPGGASYDSTWRNPTVHQDLYKENVWDPDLGNYGWHYDWDHRENYWQQDYGWHLSKYNYSPNESGSTQDPSYRWDRELQGVVREVNKLRLGDRSGKQSEHTVAELLLRDGRRVLVDLAEEQSQRSDFRLRKGDRVQIRGETGRINERRVLVAKQVRLAGQTFNINRSSPERERREGTATSDRTATYSGWIQEITPITLTDEFGRRKDFAQITLTDEFGGTIENGEIFLADLGESSIRQLGLGEGERVRLHGKRDQISGREYLRVNELSVNGRDVQLQRQSRSGEGQSGENEEREG